MYWLSLIHIYIVAEEQHFGAIGTGQEVQCGLGTEIGAADADHQQMCIRDSYKAGAAPTFLVKNGRAGYVQSDSLPAGILEGAAFEKSSLTLREGDRLVLVSDGVTATGAD